MPSHRRGRDDSRERSESRSRSRTPEKVDLPNGASEISEGDYFLRNDEFRAWLKDEKHKVRLLCCLALRCVLLC